MNRKLYISIAVIALVSLACSISPSISTNGSGSTPVVVGGSNSSGVLYQDDFSDNGSGWPKESSSDVRDYSNGSYRIYVTGTYSDLIADAGTSLPADVAIDVDITLNSGSENNDFGVVCRLQDMNNFYFFQISSDGFAVIGKFVDNEMHYLSGESMMKVDGIYSGNTTNHMKAVCDGSSFYLYANGNLVASTTDTSFTSGGDVGLMAGTFDVGGVDVYFDNFVVTAP
jgi:hypothetical protein